MARATITSAARKALALKQRCASSRQSRTGSDTSAPGRSSEVGHSASAELQSHCPCSPSTISCDASSGCPHCGQPARVNRQGGPSVSSRSCVPRTLASTSVSQRGHSTIIHGLRWQTVTSAREVKNEAGAHMVDDHPAVAEQLLEGDVTARVHGGETPLKVGALDRV